jgi:pyruvate dehydrogenase E2 component (dihydrolipoamide acetyltransferase)
MESGTLVEWRRQPGDRVARGDVIAVVETDKGAIDVEVFATGVVDALLVEPGAKVPVGTVLATIREEAGEATAAAPAAPAPPAAPAQPPPAAAPAETQPAAPEPPAASAAAVRASPMARRRARELKIDLTQLKGTGPHGAVTAADVEQAVRPPAPAEANPMRRAIAAAMALSKREIPHFYLAHTVDMGPATAWLAARNAERPLAQRLVPAALFVRAVARALRVVPELNARWTGATAELVRDIHVGVAVFLRGGGLVVPAIHDADKLDVDATMAALRDLVERARAGKLRSSDLADGTITVTSLGDRGVEEVWPVIFPPQVAILGFGGVVERPWVEDGRVVPHPVVRMTLAADHRASDGHRAARLLSQVATYLEEPET